MNNWCEILSTPLPTTQAVEFTNDTQAGGVAIFLGTTRAENKSPSQSLIALDYEAYGEMAGKQLLDLASRAREKWPIIKLAILHRTGRVMLAEPSVIIAVSTQHRAQAFDACRWLIDTLKSEVAIWKKEVWSDGNTTWVEGTFDFPPTPPTL